MSLRTGVAPSQAPGDRPPPLALRLPARVRRVLRARYAAILLLSACSPLFAQDLSRVDFLYLHRNAGDNLQQSIGLLKTGLAKRPDDPETLWRLGRSLERRGENETDKKEKLATFDQARQYLERALALKPDAAEAHFFLGITLGRIGQTRGVLKSLFLVGPIRREMKDTLRLDPKHGGAHHVLGEMLREIPGFAGGSKKGAVRELEEAVELDPNRTAHYTALAQAYLDVGEKEKARAALEKMLTIRDPADPAELEDDTREARQMLARLSQR